MPQDTYEVKSKAQTRAEFEAAKREPDRDWRRLAELKESPQRLRDEAKRLAEAAKSDTEKRQEQLAAELKRHLRAVDDNPYLTDTHKKIIKFFMFKARPKGQETSFRSITLSKSKSADELRYCRRTVQRALDNAAIWGNLIDTQSEVVFRNRGTRIYELPSIIPDYGRDSKLPKHKGRTRRWDLGKGHPKQPPEFAHKTPTKIGKYDVKDAPMRGRFGPRNQVVLPATEDSRCDSEIRQMCLQSHTNLSRSVDGVNKNEVGGDSNAGAHHSDAWTLTEQDPLMGSMDVGIDAREETSPQHLEVEPMSAAELQPAELPEGETGLPGGLDNNCNPEGLMMSGCQYTQNSCEIAEWHGRMIHLTSNHMAALLVSFPYLDRPALESEIAKIDASAVYSLGFGGVYATLATGEQNA